MGASSWRRRVIVGGCAVALATVLAAGCGGDDGDGNTGSGGTGGAGTGGAGTAGGAGSGGGTGTAGGGVGGAGGGPVDEPTCGSPDVAPATPPSCAAGAPGAGDDCGPGAESCCASAFVACGTFQPSYDGMTYGVPTPPATLSDHRLDVYEITVGRFRAFVDAGMGTQQSPPNIAAGTHPHILGSGWNLAWNQSLAPTTADLISALRCHNVHAAWTDAPGANEGLPMNCISWFEAFAFCAWDGGRLPTEMEWNHAAAGGDEQREYPWGSGIDSTRAVYGCVGGNCAADYILPVGSKSPAGDGRFGQSDLAGSMAEWTLDWFQMMYTDGCVDCANVLTGTERVMRGGSFVSQPTLVLASFRDKVAPIVGDVAGRYRHVGARCARSP